jgi:hypothetical protein
MEHQNNGQHPIEDHDNSNHPAGIAHAPSTLAPAVLSRLGLQGGEILPSSGPGDLIAALNDSDWRARAAAIRALEKIQTAAARKLFLTALNDEDGTVRAAAVHALGTIGGQAVVDPLTAALLDPEWHVRETAALALGKLTQDIPLDPLLTTLNDTDSTVREAAQLALQWRQSGNMAAPRAVPGAIGETTAQQTPAAHQAPQTRRMQDLQQKPEKPIVNTFKTAFQFRWGNTAGMRENKPQKYANNIVGEQMQEQEYENRELQYNGYGEETTTRWDKVTSYRPERKHRNLRRVGIGSAIVLLIIAVNAVVLGLYTFSKMPVIAVSPGHLIANISLQALRIRPCRCGRHKNGDKQGKCSICLTSPVRACYSLNPG